MRQINTDLYNKSLDVARLALNGTQQAPYEVRTFGLTLALALLITEENQTEQSRDASAESVKLLLDGLLLTMR